LAWLLAVTVVGCAGPNAARAWVDQIEGDQAVIVVQREDGGWTSYQVPLEELPPDLKEGDALADGQVDEVQSAATRRRVRELLDRAESPPVVDLRDPD
jgi:hypothetical protein